MYVKNMKLSIYFTTNNYILLFFYLINNIYVQRPSIAEIKKSRERG